VNTVAETDDFPRFATTAAVVRWTAQPAGTEKLSPGPWTTRVETCCLGVEPPQAERMTTSARRREILADNRKDPPIMAKTKDKVSDAANNAKPYIDRALHDEELRESVRSAYESARSIYNELIGKRGVSGVATRVATDKDIQDELRSTIAELRNAAGRVQGKPAQGKRSGGLLLVGIVLGVLFNPVTGPKTRKWLSDRIFGGGDDFTYEGGSGNGSGS
jgi:hypothetical protein